jgi:hypothetical protein
MRRLAFILLICAPAALAGDDSQFRAGALGLSWGATLQQVQSAYPGGLTWPVQGRLVEGVVYAIPGNAQMLGVTTPVQFVQFIFNKKNELQNVFFHFNYDDRDSALYNVAEILGQEYSVKDEGVVRKYSWKIGKLTQAQFEAGTSAAHPWAQLGLQGTKTP